MIVARAENSEANSDRERNFMTYGPSLNSGDVVASLFLPDPLDCDQYHQVFYKKSSLEPEKKLMLAVLGDAVACFQDYSSPRNAREEGLFRDAEGTWKRIENGFFPLKTSVML